MFRVLRRWVALRVRESGPEQQKAGQQSGQYE